MRAVFTGFRRGKTTQDENHALLRVEGLNDRREVAWYLGKRVVYVYRTKRGYRVLLILIFIINRLFGEELHLHMETTE